jgi:hypothetical protein
MSTETKGFLIFAAIALAVLYWRSTIDKDD